MRSRRFNSQHVDTEGSWAISYGDMITLLLSFFVIYFSTDFNKQVEESLSHRVESELEKLKGDLNKEAPTPLDGSLKSIPLAAGEEIPENVDVKIYKAGKSFMIRFEGISFFNSGSVELTPKAQKVLAKVVPRLEPFLSQYKVKIRAFTDSVPVTWGKHRFKDNLELSALRAIAAMRVLDKAGIPLNRLEVAGYGPMSSGLLKFLKIATDNEEQKNALSRSIIVLLKRDEYEKS